LRVATRRWKWFKIPAEGVARRERKKASDLGYFPPGRVGLPALASIPQYFPGNGREGRKRILSLSTGFGRLERPGSGGGAAISAGNSSQQHRG
jgi:hypothetical protein